MIFTFEKLMVNNNNNNNSNNSNNNNNNNNKTPSIGLRHPSSRKMGAGKRAFAREKKRKEKRVLEGARQNINLLCYARFVSCHFLNQQIRELSNYFLTLLRVAVRSTSVVRLW